MKILIIIISTFLSLQIFAQGSTYYVSMKRTICASAGTDVTEIFVTDPTGVTTQTTVANAITNTSQFGSDVNSIFNNIYSLGYQLVPVQITSNSSVVNGCNVGVSNYLFGKNWTLTSQELDSANSTQLNIINVFPNPTNGYVKIKFDYKQFHKPTNVIVYDANGIVLINELISLSSDILDLDIARLADGEYFVVLMNNKEFCEAKKLIKR